MARQTLFPIPTLVSLALAGAALAAEAPVAVSPGHASKLALVEARCPTFSWGEVEGAKSYELVVYRVGDGADSEPVLSETFAGSVSGWTPSLDRCLERGGQYAWSVRAMGGKEAAEWSVLSLFEVASGPSAAEFEELLALVKRYPAQVASGAAGTPPVANRTVPGEVGPEGRAPRAESTSHGPHSGVVISESNILIGGRPVVLAEGKIVFASSTTHQGNLGGLAGADALCNGLAEAAGLAGDYKAWLSDSDCGPAMPCRGFTQSSGPYVRPDGRRIADDWSDLTDGALQSPISIDEVGDFVNALAWTNTKSAGSLFSADSADSCLNWLTNSALEAFKGSVGQTLATSNIWTTAADEPFLRPCDSLNRLYCFEQ